MATPFLGQILLVPFNFAPQGWAYCQGQLLPIVQNTALFSLLGTNYGGNGTSTFALPNLQGQVIVGSGQGAGLSGYYPGYTGGSATTALLVSQMPSHNHTFPAAPLPGNIPAPGATNALAAIGRGARPAYAAASDGTVMAGSAVAAAGGVTAHNNMMPFLTLSYIIALTGIFPSRS